VILHIKVEMPDFSFAKVREIQEQLEVALRGYAIKLSVEDPYEDDEDDDDEYYDEDEDEEF